MRIVQWLGGISDAVTLRMVSANRQVPHSPAQNLQRLGGIRRAQLQAVLAMTPVMMSSNILAASSILVLEVNIAQAGAGTFIWAGTVFLYSAIFWVKSRKLRGSSWRPLSSSRATGKIVLSSVLLALLWACPALAIMDVESGFETTFISIATAGMITGGALALYPVPFAAASYACILTAATLPAVFWGSRELLAPFIMAITAFIAIIILSVRRQAGLFFLELDAKINAEGELGIVKLILDSVSGEGKQVTWQTDKSSRIICSYQALESILGLPHGGTPTTLHDVLSSTGLTASNDLGAAVLQQLKDGDLSALLAEPVLLSNSEGRTYKLAGRHTLNSSGFAIGYHGYIKDITEQTHNAQRIVTLATRDHATGLWNYPEFLARSDRLRLNDDGACKRLFLFIDADHLKAVNDRFGHAAGDVLIMNIAEGLQRTLPRDAIIGRKGGDEFVAFLPVRDARAALEVVETLMGALRSRFDYGASRIEFTCSIGASLSDSEKSLELLELEADRALYDAKRSHRKGWRFYDDLSGHEVTRSRGLITDLPFALGNSLIDLFYQPIVATDGCTILGSEALLRWSHPRFGMVSPPDVLAAAKSTGLMNRLSLYLLRQACATASQWPVDRFVSVNMCATDFQLPGLSDSIINLLEEMNFSPERLWLEITELEAIGKCMVTADNMSRLRATGIRIAIDDFGAGYSSLNLFATSAFDVVKIDRTLMASCRHRSSGRLILEAVRSVAQATGCIIVAEGIETESEYLEMRELGCHAFQGYLFGKALPANIIREQFRADEALLHKWPAGVHAVNPAW